MYITKNKHTAHRNNINPNEINQPVTQGWITADLCHSWKCSLMLFNEKLAVGTAFNKYNFSPVVMSFSHKQPAPSVFLILLKTLLFPAIRA